MFTWCNLAYLCNLTSVYACGYGVHITFTKAYFRDKHVHSNLLNPITSQEKANTYVRERKRGVSINVCVCVGVHITSCLWFISGVYTHIKTSTPLIWPPHILHSSLTYSLCLSCPSKLDEFLSMPFLGFLLRLSAIATEWPPKQCYQIAMMKLC